MSNYQPVDIGNRIEPFVDDFLIDSLEEAELKLHHPERREVAFQCDAPWESNTAFFNGVIQEGDRVRLYYRAATDRNRGDDFQSIAVAESYDRGVSFIRPSFRIVDHEGSSANNLIARGDMPLVPPPFLDTRPGVPEAERYKGLCSTWRKLYAMCSEDGITWRLMRDEPIEMSGTFDTVNTAFWDGRIGRYRSFTRYFQNVDLDAEEADVLGAETTAVRSIQSSTSEDFLSWAEPVPHAYADGAERTQLYTNATVPCPGAPHIYLSFPNRYVQHRVPDPDHGHPGVNDALFMSSRDGVNWHRFLDAWVRPGLDPYNWTDRNNYPIWGIVETSASEWSMYVSEHYRRPGVPTRLRRLAVRPFGFASLHAGYGGGAVLTRALTFAGSELYINASTSAAGGIRVAVLAEDGSPIEGFGEQDMEEHYGDSLASRISWKGQRSLSRLAGRPVRLRFSLTDADLYAIQIV